MGVDALLERMRQQTSQQITEILAEAKAFAARSAQEARTAATWERSRYLSDCESRLRADSEATLEKLRRASRQELLAARVSAVGAVLNRASALAAELVHDPAWLTRVRADIDLAAQAIGDQGGRLTVPTPVAEQVRAGLPSSIELHLDESLAGFRLQSHDGRVLVEQTIADVLRRRGPALRIAAARALDRMS